jgi:hypothetical protein
MRLRICVLIMANITISAANPTPMAASGHRNVRQLRRGAAGAATKVRFTSSCNSLRVAGCICKGGSPCSLRFFA